MDQTINLGWVLAAWVLLGVYVGWDLRRVRSRARREVDRMTDPGASADDRKHARRRILSDFEDFQRSRQRPLWWRWSHSMVRPGNLMFGALLGLALIATGLWLDQGTVAEAMRYFAALCLALAVLTGVAWVVRRTF